MSTRTENNYDLLIRKLDEFVRKFYINKLIRGSIYCGTVLLGTFLLFTFAEYKFYFSTGVRTVLFFSFIGGGLFALYHFIGNPLMKFYRLGKIISHEKASTIIGEHFSSIQDRLLNALQLKNLSSMSNETALIEASINQKIETLKPVPFSSAINLSLNKKYLKFLAIPSAVLVFMLFAAPSILREGTERLLDHNTFYEREAPFKFSIENKKLETLQFQDFEMNVKVSGDALPDEAYIEVDGISYKLNKKSKNEFSYVFSRPQKSLKFNFAAGGFQIGNYQLEVLPKPVIVKFETALNYPAYIGKQNETIKNTGDLNIPQGTKVNWKFFSQNTEQLSLRIGNKLFNAASDGSEEFILSQQMMEDKPYTIFVSNNKTPNADSMNFSITVVPDLYPTISVTPMEDSTNRKYLYFAGELSDDYGLRKLQLKYSITNADVVGQETNNGGGEKSVDVPFTQGKNADFSQFWDLNLLNLQPGDKVNYYFEVWDNDGVNGSKSTKSAAFNYEMPTMKEFEKEHNQDNKDIKDNLNNSIKQVEKLQENFEKLQEKLQDKKNLDWNDKKQIQDLMNQQQQVQKQIEQTKELFNQSQEKMKDFKTFDPELQKKQEELKNLFDKVLTPEMQEMMKKLNEMLDKMNKDKTQDQLKQNQLNNDELKKEMDRMLNLFKQLEFQQKFEDATKKLDSLAQKQDDLNKKTDDSKNKDANDLKAKQDSLNKQFDDLKKELDDLKKLNSELEKPMEMPDTKQDEQKISDELQKSSDDLKNSDSKSASKSQKSASQDMKDLADKMNSAMEQQQQEQTNDDMDKVRHLLENLIKVSFDEEDLIDQTKKANIYNPQYLELMKKQHDLKDDLKMIEDSITELAKTQFQMKSYVGKQIQDIEKNLDAAVENLEARQPYIAASNEQYIMTSVNNLALMFEEMLQQLQQQQMAQSKMPGSGSCNKPGGKGSKPSFSKMQSMQKQLNDQMQALQKALKEGKKPGNNPNGQQSGMGMSEQVAKMAQQQAMIRQQLQQLAEQMDPNGQPAKDLKEMQQQMDNIEKQLVNKNITDEMLKQQQKIYNKLLDYEKAEKKQGEDNQRQSNEGKDMLHAVPPGVEEYLKKKQSELDLYKTVPPGLNPFYKNLVEDYFKEINH